MEFGHFQNVHERDLSMVTRGCIEPLPCGQTIKELDAILGYNDFHRRNPVISRTNGSGAMTSTAWT